MKTALHAILHEQNPMEEVLRTALAESEHSVNSGPLTDVSLDPRDHEALTPNHFAIGTSSGELKLDRIEANYRHTRRQYKIAQHVPDSFWKRWLKEYLPTLIPRPKWHEKVKPPKVGDLVLIVDYEAPRNTWKKGTISQVLPGEDGQVRIEGASALLDTVKAMCSENAE